jgi:hypothetical protein
MKEKLSFEIAAQIWGSVHSLKDCPREFIAARCNHNRRLSLEVCKRFIGTILSSVRISRACFVKPFWEIAALDCNYNIGDDLCG